MKVKNVVFAARKANVFDFETPSHTYLLKGGLISHNTQEMYSKDVVSGGCLVEGEAIQMFDGSLVEIQNIHVGDMVNTLDGPKLVTHTWTPETLEFGEPECYEVEFEDGSTVKCSNHHPFLIGDEWVDAEDLQVGDIAKVG